MAWLDHKIPPPIVGAVAALAMWGLSMAGPQFDMALAPRTVAVGILIAASLAFDLLGLLAFRSAHTTVNPLKPERASVLVQGGVYRFTRNPMYVGLGLLLLAWAVYLSALLPFAAPAAFVLYVTRFQIQPEERVLRQLFGQEYQDYATRVRRWL